MTKLVPATDRLRFRPYMLGDLEAAFGMFADDDARAYYPQMAEPEHVQGWIEWNLRNYKEHGFGLWALELRTSGEFVGDCGLTFQEVEGRQELEVGYHIVHSHRRQGLASEAARASLDYGFSNTHSTMVCSIVSVSNVASRQVAERVHTHWRRFMKNDQQMLLFYTPRAFWRG